MSKYVDKATLQHEYIVEQRRVHYVASQLSYNFLDVFPLYTQKFHSDNLNWQDKFIVYIFI